jgi:hypothetical protein
MNSDLSFAQIALLIAYAGGMAGGQVLFKMAALKGVADGPMVERLFSMMLNRFFAAAVLLYAALTVLWVWILNFTPLSRAYVFVALAFAVTPLHSSSRNQSRCGSLLALVLFFADSCLSLDERCDAGTCGL